MPYSVSTTQYWEDIVEWLQENVGTLQWSRPVVEWKGVNWSMHAHGISETANKMSYIVRLNDERHVVLFALRWS